MATKIDPRFKIFCEAMTQTGYESDADITKAYLKAIKAAKYDTTPLPVGRKVTVSPWSVFFSAGMKNPEIKATAKEQKLSPAKVIGNKWTELKADPKAMEAWLAEHAELLQAQTATKPHRAPNSKPPTEKKLLWIRFFSAGMRDPEIKAQAPLPKNRTGLIGAQWKAMTEEDRLAWSQAHPVEEPVPEKVAVAAKPVTVAAKPVAVAKPAVVKPIVAMTKPATAAKPIAAVKPAQEPAPKAPARLAKKPAPKKEEEEEEEEEIKPDEVLSEDEPETDPEE